MAPIDLGLALADRFDDAPLWVEPLAIVEVESKELSIVGGFVRVMNLNTILWNVRGLNDYFKRMREWNLLKRWKVDIACLQETKFEFITRVMIRSDRGGLHVDWLFLGSVGGLGAFNGTC